MAVLLLAYIAHACWNECCLFELAGKQSAKDPTAFQYHRKKPQQTIAR